SRQANRKQNAQGKLEQRILLPALCSYAIALPLPRGVAFFLPGRQTVLGKADFLDLHQGTECRQVGEEQVKTG
ncbi:hypothetical protein, partial [Rhizobium sp. RSm-3]|uniref:hypothetical protein n=1 Tax=Rhizobium sp. RSm-3 TaxID=1720346 RepID=UPI001AECA2B6